MKNAPSRQTPELLAADIGSTLTKLSAFGGLGHHPRLLGQSTVITTLDQGNVSLGLEAARIDLEKRFGLDTSKASLLASSSAAGGLRMTVHGLTRDMTLRAGREASLGAGAIVAFATAGLLQPADVTTMRQLNPNLILLTGGVDDGDRSVVTANARALAEAGLPPPVIYAGNASARSEVEAILRNRGIVVFSVENVYPRIDELNVEPVRKMIQQVFAEHIITAPGMEQVKATVAEPVMPTPGAVMAAAELLAERLGDLMVVDVGGATTDIHSVTEGSSRYAGLRVAPEPRCKRTVEGDLGVYINARHVLEASQQADVEAAVARLPAGPRERATAVALTRWAVNLAVWRHAGELRATYGASGRRELAEGRDLTAVRNIIGTGGALVRLGAGEAILRGLRRDPRGRKLLPPEDARILLDRGYIMAAAGLLCRHRRTDAQALLAQSLGL